MEAWYGDRGEAERRPAANERGSGMDWICLSLVRLQQQLGWSNARPFVFADFC